MNLLRHIDPLTKVLLFLPLHEMTASRFSALEKIFEKKLKSDVKEVIDKLQNQYETDPVFFSDRVRPIVPKLVILMETS
jgi:hypothetical protein